MHGKLLSYLIIGFLCFGVCTSAPQPIEAAPRNTSGGCAPALLALTLMGSLTAGLFYFGGVENRKREELSTEILRTIPAGNFNINSLTNQGFLKWQNKFLTVKQNRIFSYDVANKLKDFFSATDVQSIFTFRQHLLHLDTDGKVYVWSPSYERWANITPSDQKITSAMQEGNSIVLVSDKNQKWTYSENLSAPSPIEIRRFIRRNGKNSTRRYYRALVNGEHIQFIQSYNLERP